MLFTWVSLPLVSQMSSMLIHLSSPVAISYWWNLGSLLGMLMVIQIASGWLLTLMYTNSSLVSFDSIWILHLESWNGSLIHWVHMNVASFIFLFLYLHFLKGLYVQSWKGNKLVWLSGVILLVLTMGTAFLGYVLPFGQMSLWGATVITNLISVISPLLVTWVWAGYYVNSYTLSLFFSLHYLLPMVLLVVIMMHLILLHYNGSTNMSIKTHFWPLFAIKDAMNLILILMMLYWTLKYTYYTADPDNFIKANPSISPIHIKPEWYFLQYYAILRSIPNKPLGVFMFAMSIVMMFMLVTNNSLYSSTTSLVWTMSVTYIFMTNLLLIFIGASPVEWPYLQMGQILTIMYFTWFGFYSVDFKLHS